MRFIPLNPDDDYFTEILTFLLSSPTPPKSLYPCRQAYIQFLSINSISLNLTHETFTESVSILDQLVTHSYEIALVCLWISAKINENYGRVPLLSTLVRVVDTTRERMKRIEREVLDQIGFSSGKSVEEFVRVYVALEGDVNGDLVRCLAEVVMMNGGVDTRMVARRAVEMARGVEMGECDLMGITPWIREKYSRKEFGNVYRLLRPYDRLRIDTGFEKSVNTGLLTPPKEEYGYEEFQRGFGKMDSFFTSAKAPWAM